MGSVKCQECRKDFPTNAALHKHIKAHKLSQTQYYQKYYPRYDKFTGAFILFKNRDFYLTADFNTRANLAQWLAQTPKDEIKRYIAEWFARRKRRKKLTYAPCQVELRTLPIPGMKYLSEMFGDYFEFAKGLGFQNKFTKYQFSKTKLNFTGKHRIIVDTREQCPLEFSIPQISETLNFGDYKLNDDYFAGKCCIERKSMIDLFGTMTGGYDRFCRELDRAKEAGSYLIIVVESPLEALENTSDKIFNYSGTRLSPEFIQYSIREICQNYPEVQFLFVADRNEASKAIERIFCSSGEYRDIDLQYLYDTKGLI